MSALLEVAGLAKAYQGVRALDDVGFRVERGRIVGVIGPNGSGKSTMIDCISSFQRPDRGTVRLEGRSIGGLPAHRVARAGLMRTFQNIRVYEHLTVMETLLNAMVPFDAANWIDAVLRTGRLRREEAQARARAEGLIRLVGLERYTDAPAGILSYGQKKLVALVAALMPRPKLVVLDEPVAGVNPSRIREIEAAIRQLQAGGETFLIVEHNTEFIMNLSDRVIVLDQGRILTEGTPHEVHRDERVLEAYLGARA